MWICFAAGWDDWWKLAADPQAKEAIWDTLKPWKIPLASAPLELPSFFSMFSVVHWDTGTLEYSYVFFGLFMEALERSYTCVVQTFMLKSIIDAWYVEVSEIKGCAVQTRYNEFSIGIKCLPMPCWSNENSDRDDEHQQHGWKQQVCLPWWQSVFPKEDDAPECAYKWQRLEDQMLNQKFDEINMNEWLKLWMGKIPGLHQQLHTQQPGCPISLWDPNTWIGISHCVRHDGAWMQGSVLFFPRREQPWWTVSPRPEWWTLQCPVSAHWKRCTLLHGRPLVLQDQEATLLKIEPGFFLTSAWLNQVSWASKRSNATFVRNVTAELDVCILPANV